MAGAPVILRTVRAPPVPILSKNLPGVIRFDNSAAVVEIFFVTFEQVWMEAFEKVFAKMQAHGTDRLYDLL